MSPKFLNSLTFPLLKVCIPLRCRYIHFTYTVPVRIISRRSCWKSTSNDLEQDYSQIISPAPSLEAVNTNEAVAVQYYFLPRTWRHVCVSYFCEISLSKQRKPWITRKMDEIKTILTI